MPPQVPPQATSLSLDVPAECPNLCVSRTKGCPKPGPRRVPVPGATSPACRSPSLLLIPGAQLRLLHKTQLAAGEGGLNGIKEFLPR